MKNKKIKAIFKGLNGSCGYETNKEYTLLINRNLCIETVYGSGYCEYGSILSFLENWDNIRVVK